MSVVDILQISSDAFMREAVFPAWMHGTDKLLLNGVYFYCNSLTVLFQSGLQYSVRRTEKEDWTQLHFWTNLRELEEKIFVDVDFGKLRYQLRCIWTKTKKIG